MKCIHRALPTIGKIHIPPKCVWKAFKDASIIRSQSHYKFNKTESVAGVPHHSRVELGLRIMGTCFQITNRSRRTLKVNYQVCQETQQWRLNAPTLMGCSKNISIRDVSEIKKQRKISSEWATSKVLR